MIEQESASDDGQAIVVGIALTALGTLFYAFEYVLCERLFTQYKQPVDSKQLCLYTGMWGMLFTLVWMCVYTFPNWEQIVMQEVRDAGGRPWVILALYVSHLLSNAVHNLAWFATCELEGGVSTGLLMGVKAVILFFASSLCFCNPHRPEQCMSIAKGLATGVVLLGTTLYYWPSSFVAQRARAWARAARQPRWMPRGSVFVGRRGGGGALIRDPLSGKMRPARGGHRRIARPTQKALTTLFDMRGEAYGRLHGQVVLFLSLDTHSSHICQSPFFPDLTFKFCF